MAPLTLRRFMERQFYEPRRQDPNRTKTKAKGNPRCPICQSVLWKGKWTAPDRAKAVSKSQLKCPACAQYEQRYAMGVVELHGETLKEKKQNILETIANTENIARSRNDQERILWTRTYRGVTKVYVTLPELARHIGRELQKSFKGKTEYHRSTEEPYLRVIWRTESRSALGTPRIGRRKLNRSRAWRGRGRFSQ